MRNCFPLVKCQFDTLLGRRRHLETELSKAKSSNKCFRSIGALSASTIVWALVLKRSK